MAFAASEAGGEDGVADALGQPRVRVAVGLSKDAHGDADVRREDHLHSLVAGDARRAGDGAAVQCLGEQDEDPSCGIRNGA